MTIIGNLLKNIREEKMLKPNVVLILAENINMENEGHAHIYKSNSEYSSIEKKPVCGDEDLTRNDPPRFELKGLITSEELRIALAKKHKKEGINICANCIRAIYAQ